MPSASRAIIVMAAGVAVSIGSSVATAAPLGGAVTWSSKLGPVPGASPHTAPALTGLPYTSSKRTVRLFWTGPSQGAGFDISYQASTVPSKDIWSSPVIVDKGLAITRDQPSVAPFAPQKLILAWKDASSSAVDYAIGSETTATALKWSKPAAVPKAATASSPAVLVPSHTKVVLAVWKATTGHAVDYAIGSLLEGVVIWKRVAVIPEAAATSAPVIAERNITSGTGLVYVMWKGVGAAGPIDYVTTPDPAAGFPKWSAPHALPSSVTSATAPTAEAGGTGTSFPLLVVYGHGSSLFYVTLTKTGKTSTPAKVPHIAGLAALGGGLLATDDPGSIHYIQPYVHACGGC